MDGVLHVGSTLYAQGLCLTCPGRGLVGGGIAVHRKDVRSPGARKRKLDKRYLAGAGSQ